MAVIPSRRRAGESACMSSPHATVSPGNERGPGPIIPRNYYMTQRRTPTPLLAVSPLNMAHGSTTWTYYLPGIHICVIILLFQGACRGVSEGGNVIIDEEMSLLWYLWSNIRFFRHNRKKLLRQYANNFGFINWSVRWNRGGIYNSDL